LVFDGTSPDRPCPLGPPGDPAPRRTARRRAGAWPGIRSSCAVAALVATLAGGPPVSAEPLPPLRLVPSPPTIDVAQGPAHDGEVVVLEATIARSKLAAGRIVLEPEGETSAPVRIVLVPPMIGESARRLADRYPGRQVRVTGRIHEFDGEYEI